MHATIDDNHLKDLMKIALMELLEEHPAMLRGLMAEALEDMTTDRRPPREERDYDEDDFPRRHSARTPRSRVEASAAFGDVGEAGHGGHRFTDAGEGVRRTSTGPTMGFSTPNPDTMAASGRWGAEAHATEVPPMGSTASDYGTAFGADPFFRPPPTSGAARAGRVHNRAGNLRPASFTTGAAYLSEGFELILHGGLRRYVVLPMATSVLLFSVALWVGMGQFGAFGHWAHGYLPFWLGWIEWLLWPFFAIAPVAIIFYFFTLATNIIAAPFNALLAEKVSRQMSGLPLGGGPGFGAALLRVPSSMKGEWRKSVWFVLRALALLVLFFIPLLNLLAPLVWVLFASWSLALKYLDYSVANQDMEFDETRALAAENRWLVLGFGVSVLLVTIVPVLNFVAMPIAVAGASALWTERLALRRNSTV